MMQISQITWSLTSQILSQLANKMVPLHYLHLNQTKVASLLSNQVSTTIFQTVKLVPHYQRWVWAKSMRVMLSCKTLLSHSTQRMWEDASREERLWTLTCCQATNFLTHWSLQSMQTRPRKCKTRCIPSPWVRWTWCKCFFRKFLANLRSLESKRKS